MTRKIGDVTDQEVERVRGGGGSSLPAFKPQAQPGGATVKLPSGMIVPYEMINRLKDRRAQDKTGNIVSIYEDFRAGGLDPADRCPNCGGPKGSGLIYAPTGEKCDARLFGHTVTTPRRNIDGETYYSEESIPLRRKMEGFPCPVCSGNSRREFMIERSGLLINRVGSPEGKRTWAEIDHRIYSIPGREDFEAAINTAIAQWTAGNTTGWLTMIGGYGSGKTACGEAIVKRAINAGTEAMFVEAGTLFDAVNNTFGNFDTDPQTVLMKWREVPILVVDELDWRNTRKHSGDLSRAAEEVLTMLNSRYRAQRATAIISPLDWWMSDLEGNLILNPNQGSDWKAVLSRASEGWIAYTTIQDQRQTFGRVRRGEQ